MKRLLSLRRQVTIAYFVATVFLLLLNASLIDIALEFAMDESSEQRLEYLSDFAAKEYQSGATGTLILDNLTMAYDDYRLLPDSVRVHFNDSWRGTEDFRHEDWNGGSHITVWAGELQTGAATKILYLVENTAPISIPDRKEYTLMTGFMLISLLVLAGSLLLIDRIARYLTAPLTRLAAEIERSDVNDLSAINTDRITTEEQALLVNALNRYRQRIQAGIERERAFSRYVSHELRTPLTVISGVATLLEVSNAPDFLAKQRQRLTKACQNMTDITETLLNLVREKKTTDCESHLDQSFLAQLVEDHRSLLDHKPVKVEIEADTTITVKVPETVLRILVGNLLKNAFDYTREGEIRLRLHDNRLKILDTGPGLDVKPEDHAGHGLGLLMVKDICRQNHWTFTLGHRGHDPGCQAIVDFTERQT